MHRRRDAKIGIYKKKLILIFGYFFNSCFFILACFIIEKKSVSGKKGKTFVMRINEFCNWKSYPPPNIGSADLVGWYVRQIKNKVVPLLHGFNKAFTCHPSRCAYRQLRGCEF